MLAELEKVGGQCVLTELGGGRRERVFAEVEKRLRRNRQFSLEGGRR